MKCVFGVVLFAAVVSAQTVSGTLAGRVTDPSGAVVPGASVIAKNEETQLTREARTNHEGYYSLSFIRVDVCQG